MEKKKKKEKIPFRINIIFFTVFIIFAVLIIRLGDLQILDGKAYQSEIDRTVSDLSQVPVPRGEIFDKNGKVIVGNEARYSITYTPPKRVQAQDKLDLAEKLVDYMSLNKKQLKKITERDKREYLFLEQEEEIEKKLQETLSEEEEEAMDAGELYQMKLDMVEEDLLDELDDKTLDIIAIKKELDKATELTPEIIKNEGISTEEYARIAENLSELPGINVATDWARDYKYKDTLKSIVGSITSSDEGIPKEKEDYYLSRGYNRNERVGKSGLEEEYEELLRGRKEKVQYTTTKAGAIIDSKVMVEGEKGKNLQLSIDIDFQEKIDKILLDELKKVRSEGNPHVTDALIVTMNPKTGELLSLNGQRYDKDKKRYDKIPSSVILDTHRPGSIVKGATVAAGLEEGVVSPGETIYDATINIAGSNPVHSYQGNLGPVNDISALQKSSNIYMAYIDLRMGGDFRYPYPKDAQTYANADKGLSTLRYYYQQFGLGASTGIDFPKEANSFQGEASATGLLFFGFGQYDTYSVMQMGQYISTIANDGYRMEPHIVKNILNSKEFDSDDVYSVYKTNNPKIMNKLSVEDVYISRVQEGFYKAFNEPGGTGYSYWNDAKYKPAGKTGTAENEVYEQLPDGTFKKVASTKNLALVGYAPYDNPEIAFAVIVPNLNEKSKSTVNHNIGRKVMDLYFKDKE